MRTSGQTIASLLVLCVLAAPAWPAEPAGRPWDEAAKGPLPRWRLGPDGGNATPAPAPGHALVPRAIALDRSGLRPEACTIASPPEYAPVEGVLYRYSTSSWRDVVVDLVASLTGDPSHDEIAYVVVSDSSQQSFAESDFMAAGADLAKVEFIIEPSDSIWIRDYGPHAIRQGDADAIVDSHYYPGRSNDNFIPTLVADDHFIVPSYDIPLYYSGGNFQPAADRSGFVTELIYADNPGFTETFIAALYQEYQGIDTLHVMPQLPSSVDGTGHIDMWLYLVDADTVIISEFLPGSNQEAIDITNNAVPYMEGLGYEVFRVPAFNAIHPGQGNTHYTYTNAYRVNDRIFIPSYGEGDPSYLTYDTQAIAAWQQAAGAGVEIVPINSYGIIWAAGAIHCIVKQVPRYTATTPSACATSPSGGELLVPGSTREITWTADDDGTIASVDLLYSIDGGLTYPPVQTIATGLADTGSFDWAVPQIESGLGRVKVVAHDDTAATVEAESEADFAIESALRRTYDFSAGSGVDRFAYGESTASWTAVDGVRLPVATEIAADDYAKIAASDASGGAGDPNRYASVMNLPADFLRESTHVFEFTIAEAPAEILDIELVWEGFSAGCAQMEMYVWDVVAGQWCDGRGNCGENRFVDNYAGNRDESLRGDIRTAFDRYIDGSGRLTLLLYTERNFNRSYHDYVAVTVTSDPCPGSDFDFDGFADPCDNCLSTVNPTQADGDLDTHGDACDCAPADATAFAAPLPITNVTVLNDKTTLQWDSDAPNSGSGTLYDVLSGLVGEFPVGSGSGESCAGDGISGTTLPGLGTPAEGTGHYYVVRGTNVCATGSYGADTSENERNGTACP